MSMQEDCSLRARINLYYDLYLPDRTPAPLLIALHGYGANKRQMMREAKLIAPNDFAIEIANQSLLRSLPSRSHSRSAADCVAWVRRKQASNDARSETDRPQRLRDRVLAGTISTYSGT